MVKSTAKEVYDIVNGNAPLLDENGNAIIDAKPTTRSMPGGLESATILKDAYGNVIGGGPISWNNAYVNQQTYSPIGDYTYSGGFSGASVIPGTKTDIAQQYINTNAKTMEGLSWRDWFNAASKGVLAAMKLPTNDKTGDTLTDILGTVGTVATGAVMSQNPVTKGLWVFGNVLSSLNDSLSRKVDDYYSQEVEYDLAGLFETDANGKLVFRPDYTKMGDAGPESGKKVLAAQDTTNTGASLNGDNNLTIRVSPVFAASDSYKELLNKLEDSLYSLTEDQANEVVDEDTGTTRLQAIDYLVKASESEFLYNAQAARTIKEKAPTASDKAVDLAVDVSKVGYQKEKDLPNITVTIYNDKNEKEEVNAKEWLDSIASKDKVGRENYMVSLGNRIADSNISDDEKAVLYGQSMALYAASDSNGPYKGMYQKDWGDAIASSSESFTGLTWNELFGGTELTTFRDNEFASGLIQLGSTYASAKLLSWATGKIETGLRKVTPKISSWAGEGGVKNAIENTEQGTSSTAKYVAKIAAKSATQFGYQVVADAIYDAAKIAPYALSGNMEQYDFLEELGNDVVMDLLVTYGPGQFVESMNRPKNEYRVLVENTKTGEQEYKRYSDIKGDNNYKVIMSEQGERTVKLVEVTADELVARRIETINKLSQSDNKFGQWTQKTFFDKNMAMQRLAMDVRARDGQYGFRKLLRYANDIKVLTRDTLDEYMANEKYSKNWDTLRSVMKDVKSNIGKIRQSDWDYIKATVNEARFLAKQEGDKNAEQIVKDFYKDAKNGVSAERAEQLNKLMTAMRDVSSDVLDYYVEKGMMSKEDAAKVRAQPGFEEGMYIPMYVKRGVRGTGGEIGQDRIAIRKINDPSALISLKDIDNPLTSISRYLNNAMRAIALNDKALAIREAASVTGVGIQVKSDTGGILKEVKNLKKIDSNFDKIFKGIASKVRQNFPSYKQWQENNDKLVMRSRALRSAEQLEKLRTETKDYQRQLRNERKRKDPDNAKIYILENKVQENKLQQAKAIDDTKRYIGLVMERAKKAHKGDKYEADVEDYLNIQVTNGLKVALKAENMVGEVQRVVNEAVAYANPWVDPETIIMRRAEAAAERYRAKVVKDLESQKDTLGDKYNMAVDQVMDKIKERITGERTAEVTFIDDEGEPTRILDNHGQKDVIRYMVNGTQYEMKLTGPYAEELVSEYYAPEFRVAKTTLGKVAQKGNRVANKFAQTKRFLTTAADVTRALPNLARDWSRGIVTTGGQILISPKKMFSDLKAKYNYGSAELEKIDNGLMLARKAIDESTLTASMEMSDKNKDKRMVQALLEPDGNGFVRFMWNFKTGQIGRILAAPQDAAESFTRRRAMDTAYYKELADSQANGYSVDESIKRATEAAYFYGREATVNFSRKGTLIAKMSQQVPYLTQKFASYESFKLAYIDNPIAVTRALETTVTTYASLIAIALSNEESREKYFLLTEYDRANNIIIPLDNGSIMTIPLDDTMAKFLTPYRRMIETLNGVDPQSFYLLFAETLDALTPSDLSGFSEGDKFNVVRGFQKLGAEGCPTWALPILENMFGESWYYGSDISVDSTDTGLWDENWDPTPGEMTTKSKNSQFLKGVADATGIPQWQLQNIFSTYGGNDGQYALQIIDKLSGASEDAQGGKSFMDAIFKPFTGSDSNQVQNAFYEAINSLKEEKQKVQKKIATLTQEINGLSGDEKAKKMNERQKVIKEYGLKVSDTLNQYLSAYELTGGLPKSLGNQAWYLYKLYDDDMTDDMYLKESSGGYENDKVDDYNKKQANMLAAASGFDSLYDSPSLAYKDLYAETAFKKTVNGFGTEQMAALASILEDTSDYENSFTKLRSDVNKARKEAYANKDWDTRDALAYNYDMKIAMAIYPYLQEHGVAETLNRYDVMNYLKKWFIVPNEQQRTAKGRYVPSLGEDSEVSEAFKKQFIKKIFGVSGQ